jgi:hypothetical protein
MAMAESNGSPVATVPTAPCAPGSGWCVVTDAKCSRCGDLTLPDPAHDDLTLTRCPVCRARFIRLHYPPYGFPTDQPVIAEWRRLKWWQRP